MLDKLNVRETTDADMPAVRELTTRAFGRPDEAKIIDQLMKDGDVLTQIVGLMDDQIVAHVLFYPVGVFGKLSAVGIGPMSVDPWVQREGIGKAILGAGLNRLREVGVSVVFVVGHPEYYPKFGFAAETTEPFESPYKGPHFMAVRLRYGPPMSGRLIFPAAFGAPTLA